MTSSPVVEIESFDMRTAPDPVLQELHRLDAAFELEARPDEPPTPFAAFMAQYRSAPGFRETKGILTRQGDAVIAGGFIEVDRTGDNAHVLEAFLVVPPDLRRRGLGRALLGAVVAEAEAEARTLLLGFTNSAVPAGAAFMRSLGAAAGLEERESELDLETLDRQLLRRWMEDGPRRAPEYDLLMIEGDVPDELVEAYAALYDVSNTAPRDALDVEDSHRTPEQIRDAERSRKEAGGERILCLAQHRPTGALAGWSELARHPAEPWKVHQYWTAVHPDHRGHALGKLVKAANLIRCIERWPDAKKVTTGNAYSNDAMLGINNELGFRETIGWTVWQVPIDQVRRVLG